MDCWESSDRRLCRRLAALLLVIATFGSSEAWSQEPRRIRNRLAPDRQWDHQWLDGAVFYEVFVRSFADSDGDGVGDLQGLTSRLDYLNDGDPTTTDDLGVTALWLMPIFPSPSYHGYDVTDYEGINPDYGTLDDFRELVDEAHRRGIRIILDLVINHSSSQHPWFVDSSSSPASPLRDWYVWSASNPGWGPPWGGSAPTWHLNTNDGHYYYGIFWSGMPDLNLRTRALRAEVIRLARLWLDRGADGFRLDAARYLIETGAGLGQADTAETHAFWREFSAAVRHHSPAAVLVGENWADSATIASYYGSTEFIVDGDELPMNFNFPLASAVLGGARNARAAPILDTLEDVARLYPERVRDTPFLTNHDHVRAASQLGSPEGRLRVAASALLTMAGVPFLYYGEEVGMLNGSGSGDEAKRTPMPWNDSPGGGFTTGSPWYPFSPERADRNVEVQMDVPDSLLSHYRGLIAARAGSPALGGGALSPLDSGGGQSAILAFLRERGSDRVLVVINLGGGFTTTGSLAVPGVPVEALYEDGDPGQPSGTPGSWSIVMPPYSTAIWQFTAE